MKRYLMIIISLLAATAQNGYGMMVQLPHGGYEHAVPLYDVYYSDGVARLYNLERKKKDGELFFGQLYKYGTNIPYDSKAYLVLSPEGKELFSDLEEYNKDHKAWVLNNIRAANDPVELVAQPPMRRNRFRRW